MRAMACVCQRLTVSMSRRLSALGTVRCGTCGRKLSRAATVERLRPIGLGHAEAQRFRRAEDRDDLPAWPRKDQCPGCVASRAADWANRWPIGDCGPDCLRRAARRAS